ncbi:MAG: response regulator transcription factor [Acidipila sp.]|nr:response regulator transcription factor [Acidipila sp.]
MTINTLIVDDEKPAREELAFLLKAFPEIHVVAQGRNGLEAVAMIREHSPDLVFLDVQMPGLDGFGVIKKLLDRKVRLPQFVFATAFDTYAVQAFEVNAVDYILKPFDKGRVARAIQRAKKQIDAQASPVERLETLIVQMTGQMTGQAASQTGSAPGAEAKSSTKLLLRAQQRMLLVDCNEVVYAKINDGLISMATRELDGTSNYHTLEELQAQLDPEFFWRVHRSWMVNIHHIKEVVPWFKSSFVLRMNDKKQTEVPVSRTQTRRLRELLKL